MFCNLLGILLCVVVLLQHVQTGLSEECNLTFRSKLKSRTECFTTYGGCGFNNLQTQFPNLYNKTGWRRDPPSNIKLSSFCETDVAGVNQSGLNIQWNLPNSQSAEGIAGYELRIEGDPPNFRCLVVILEENATRNNIHFVLNSTMFPVKRHYTYMIVLHSLPRANNSEPEFKHIVSMNCKRGLSSKDWKPAGHNFSYKWPEKILTVWFQPPPLEYNFTKFQIYLTQEDTLLSKIITNTTEVTFTDKEPGKYKLYMNPYDENPYDEERCVCRDDEGKCKACISSKWQIDAVITKKLPAPVSKGYLHEVIAGVCAFVAIAIVLLLLYKCLAKHYDIECVLGKSKLNKTDMLHVLCIDASSTKADASKVQSIIENNLNTKVKFSRIIALSDTNITSKMCTMWGKWKLITSPVTENSCQRSCNATAVCESMGKADHNLSVLICLLVSSFSDEKLSEYLSKIRSTIPRTGQLQAQICAVSFASKLALPNCKTALKCYSLNEDRQDFVMAVKKAFPKHTKDQDVSVMYACANASSERAVKNGVKVDKNSEPFVALPNSQTCNGRTVGNCPKTDIDIERITDRVPEVMYLDDAEPRRERYISNDSGRGLSECSYKPGHSPEDRDGFWEETTAPLSTTHHHHLISTNQNGFINKYYQTGKECPSCNISFFPPDPSVISGNDFDPSAIDYDAEDDSVNYKENAMKQFPDKKCLRNLNGFAKPYANSMDSIMDKMAEINERSAFIMEQNVSPGEVQSVWEGHV